MKYRLTEWVTKEHDTITAKDVTVLEGPIEGALIVTVDNEMLGRLMSLGPDRLQAFVDGTRDSLQAAGWDGEIVVCSDGVKFARFEPVEPLSKALPTLPEVEAEQSKAVRKLVDEDDQKILDRVRRSLGQTD